MEFKMKQLPYDYDALAPLIGAETVQIHYEKHHAGYMRKLDAALESDPLREHSLEDIVTQSVGDTYNLAAQVWNHDFYWLSLSPEPTDTPQDETFQRLFAASFTDLAEFKQRFKAAAASEFGSGWAWLVYDPRQQKLNILSTTDAVNPLTLGLTPIVTLDVWEHAYYLDYRNQRGKYIEAYLEDHINWNFAQANLLAALA